MTSLHTYDKQGRPLSDAEFMRLFGDMDYKRVAYTKISEDVAVSTVWMGMDLAFTSEPHQPIIFETMVFGGEHNDACWRYGSEEDAIAGHAAAVEAIENDESLPI